MTKQELPKEVEVFMAEINDLASDHPEWLDIFNHNFLDTLQNTVRRQDDGTTYVLTGDIPAMWLRDSTAQIRPYLFLANRSEDIRDLIKGVIERHFQMISIDPYANAFNEAPNNAGHQTDQTEMRPIVWERKYEIDSLAYPVQLAYLYWQETNDTSIFNATFLNGLQAIIETWEVEQNHENSPYRFERDTWRDADTLVNRGLGTPVAETGMTWSGFRPSDDRCEYHYLVPSNMFAVAVLGYAEQILTGAYPEKQDLLSRTTALKEAIDVGIREYAIVQNKAGDDIYAFEVDGLGHYTIEDDANIPNLISAPYLGYTTIDDALYQRTRETMYSSENRYYYEGTAASGIGSEHTPPDYIWHMALAMRGLTSSDKAEKKAMLDLMVATDADTQAMHEGFHKDDPTQYTREWFSWPNMLFIELMLDYYGYKLKGAEV